jgi:DNA-directed RNA polymerase subunit omega
MQRKKTIEDLAEDAGGMFALVVAAAKRAKQLKEGRQRVTECPSANPLTIAIQELVDGKVLVRPPGEKDGAAEAGGEPEGETAEPSTPDEE